MRLPRRFLSGFSRFFRRRSLFGQRALIVWIAGSSWSCTLITDVDREKIPVPVPPTFEEVDAGPQPPLEVPDASLVSDAAPADDAGDAGADPGDAGDDAGVPATDAG
jgi:hypothetical protein